MLHNYLITAFRSIFRHKLFSFINFAGLAVGLTAAILIGLFVQQELSFDTWLPGSERIYRIALLVHVPGPGGHFKFPHPWPGQNPSLDGGGQVMITR